MPHYPILASYIPRREPMRYSILPTMIEFCQHLANSNCPHKDTDISQFWNCFFSVLFRCADSFTVAWCQAPTGWSKKLIPSVFYALISSNIDRFSNLFPCRNQENICNNTVTKDPTTPQVGRYTTLWNVRVLKATIENKTTSVTTHFKSA